MAINPNNANKNQHVNYCGTSGAGKSVAVKGFGLVGPCAVIFDVYGDYLPNRRRKVSGLGSGRKVHHYSTRRTFLNAFAEAWASGKGFAVAYQPNFKDDKAYKVEADWFADVVWRASDGNRRLDVIFEEMAKYMDGTGKATGRIGEIATGGRKFGLVAHFVFQRPTEVPKTLTSQAAITIIGAQQTMKDAKIWQEELDCEISEIVALGVLNQENKKYYLVKRGGIGNYEQKSISF
jgi:DNA helicase HerA-like ATPase